MPGRSRLIRGAASIPAPIARSGQRARCAAGYPAGPVVCGKKASVNSWKRRGCCVANGIRARFAWLGSPIWQIRTASSSPEIDAWVSEGVVEYWGWRDDMPGVYAQAQIVCLPTYYGEGLPKSLLEAAASGCGIVATDIPGCREIVQHGVTGWLVPPAGSRALASALQQAIEQPDLREQYGAAARALIAARFFDGSRHWGSYCDIR